MTKKRNGAQPIEGGTKRAVGLWVRLAKCYGLVLREVRRGQETSGLTLPQFDVLAQLLRYPDGMTPGALSQALLVTAGNVTGVITRLSARKLLERVPHPDDRRAALLHLTPKGLKLARREVARQERFLHEILSVLRPSEQGALCESLDRLRSNLDQAAESAGPARAQGRGRRLPSRGRA